jgi:NADP-dependent 3-hydroxy acid dehydrogenase YdfG
MDKLESKVALISGGGTGIGRATAELFDSVGYKVHIFGRRENPLLEVSSKSKNIIYHIGDINQEKRIQEIVKDIISEENKIDILVNNAGIYIPGKLIDFEKDSMNQLFSTNIIGMLNLSKHVLIEMIKQKKGNIVNLASILGVIGAEDTIVYTATKGAVIAATRAMAIEYAKYGIRVNSICPSVVESNMLNEVFNNDPEFKKRLLSAHPTKEFLTPKQVAKSILYLSSEESYPLNGHNLVLDGGRSVYDR